MTTRMNIGCIVKGCKSVSFMRLRTKSCSGSRRLWRKTVVLRFLGSKDIRHLNQYVL